MLVEYVRLAKVAQKLSYLRLEDNNRAEHNNADHCTQKYAQNEQVKLNQNLREQPRK